MNRAHRILIVFLSTALLGAAQTATRFPVASIKASQPGALPKDMSVSFPPGGFQALNMTLADLLYLLNGYTGRVEGGPEWTRLERYDIVAKSEGLMPSSMRQEAILALLRERFGLDFHRENREESGIVVTVGKKPPQITPAGEGEQSSTVTDAHRAIFRAVTMANLVSYLHNMWHTVVVDQTGLAGRFDIAIDMDNAAQELAPMDSKPDFQERVRLAVEQIGLVVKNAKVPVAVTVIDRATRPEN